MTGETVLPLRNLVRVPLRLIDPHPQNVREVVEPPTQRKRGPRSPGDDEWVQEIEDLAQSIREVGLIQPLTVIPHGRRFTVIAGHRRLAACRLARVRDVPCIVRADLDGQGIVEVMLVENLHRVDLSPMEEARALARLRDEAGLTQDEIAERVGRSNAWVSSRLVLLTLPPEIQKRLLNQRIGVTEAVRLARELNGRTAVEYDRGWDTPHLAPGHPLADAARDRCDGTNHNLRRRIGGACGECWEQTIRDDERARVLGQEAAS